MEKWILEIEKEFQDCMKKFPELENKGIRIIVKKTENELSGGAGRNIVNDQEVVILFVPRLLQNQPRTLRPIIFHELSHKIDLENPDRVFMERADEKSKKLWKLLEENNALKCIVERKNKCE